MAQRSTSSLAELFWRHVETARKEECWVWTSAKNEKGYGVLKFGGREGDMVKAHRTGFVTVRGLTLEDIDGIELLHSCDNKGCPNPWHVSPGTHAQNMADMATRGRSTVGELNARSKLTWAKVREIRQLATAGMKLTEIATAYESSQSNISGIVSGKSWKE